MTYELKQHTPMIHFQHDQEGATLRATELKPKLDKFLKKWVFEKKDFESYKKLLIGEVKSEDDLKDKEAFNYKVKIFDPVNLKYEIIEKDKMKNGIIERKRDGSPKKINFPCFFANIGNENDKKFSMLNTLTIEFSSFNKEIIDSIKKVFPIFLSKTNFGTRQSKGFGSFYLSEQKYIDVLSKLMPKTYFDIETNDIKKVFTYIDIFYKSLRSGINDVSNSNPFYFKSMMFLYAKNKNIQWEKKTIKEKFFVTYKNSQQDNNLKSVIKSDIYYDKRLMKDILGLSSSEKWKSYNDVQITKKHICNEGIDSFTIERIKSPITFKPIKIKINEKYIYRIYILCNEINELLSHSEFVISNSNNLLDEKLMLPDNKEFNLTEFLKFAINQDIDKHVENKFRYHSSFIILKDIYSQLKTNIGGHND